MNHTPGPWRVGPWGEHTPHEIKSFDILIEDVNEDADIAHVQKRYTKEQTEANARLIASAPDMLEVLIDAYKIIRQHENPDLPGSAELRAIKTIIERATGRKIEEVI